MIDKNATRHQTISVSQQRCCSPTRWSSFIYSLLLVSFLQESAIILGVEFEESVLFGSVFIVSRDISVFGIEWVSEIEEEVYVGARIIEDQEGF